MLQATVSKNETQKREKVSPYQIILKSNDKSESYRIPEIMFISIKHYLKPYRSKTVKIKAVKCIDTGKIFRCAREAMMWLIQEGKTSNYNADNLIKAACKRERNIFCGFHWEFVDNQKVTENVL